MLSNDSTAVFPVLVKLLLLLGAEPERTGLLSIGRVTTIFCVDAAGLAELLAAGSGLNVTLLVVLSGVRGGEVVISCSSVRSMPSLSVMISAGFSRLLLCDLDLLREGDGGGCSLMALCG